MDKGQMTTRNGFIKRAGLAIAGIFAVGGAAGANRRTGRADPPGRKLGQDSKTADVEAIARRRLRSVEGTVRYRA